MRLLFLLPLLTLTLAAPATDDEPQPTPAPRKAVSASAPSPAEPEATRAMLRCNNHGNTPEYLTWYSKCMDKLASAWISNSLAEVGRFDDGHGCKCTYRSTVEGAGPSARQVLWDAVMDKALPCKDASYYNVDGTKGITELRFWCS